MVSDIENQFYVIDESYNSELNKQIELINVNSLHDNNLSKINKFRKSKSYPDRIILAAHKNDNQINVNTIYRKESDEDKPIFSENSNSLNRYENNQNKSEWIINFIKKICCYHYFKKINKIETLNKFLTVCLHVFIMIIFETYFYFNYVVWIERDEFLKQIDKYIGQLDNIPMDSNQKKIIQYTFNQNSDKYQLYLDYLYQQYMDSLESQQKLLHKLLIKACTMAGIVGIFFLVLFIIGLFKRKKIKWNWIWIENLLMFVFLGIFEYFFFTTIIMHYNPITDAEVKYYVVDGFVNYLNSTSY